MAKRVDTGEAPGVSSIGVGLLLVVGFVAAYFAGYAALLESIEFRWADPMFAPKYRIDHPVVEAAFAPANWADRKLLPDRWRLPKNKW
jgi:hypothetical protein